MSNYIHFIWIGGRIPHWVSHNIAEFKHLNKDHVIMIHDESSLLPEYKNKYDNITGEHLYARKSDLIRLSVMETFGGWYFDTDFLPFLSVNEIKKDYQIGDDSFFVVRATPALLANGIMFCNDADIAKSIKESILAESKDKSDWGGYGTVAITNFDYANKGVLTIGNPERFFPVPYTDRKRTIEVYNQCMNGGNIKEILGLTEMPYMIHLHAQDELVLENIC